MHVLLHCTQGSHTSSSSSRTMSAVRHLKLILASAAAH